MDKESTAAVMQRAKQTEIEVRHESEISFGNEAGFSVPERDIRPPRTEDKLKLLWDGRRSLFYVTAAGLISFTLLAFLLPNRYTAKARLMPPDYTSSISTGMAMSAVSGDSGNAGGGAPLMGLASRLLGLNTSGELIAGVLRSESLEDRVIQKFDLMKEYGAKYPEDARKKLEAKTDVQSDMKTGIITISVEDRDPRKAAAMAQEEVDGLNDLLAQVNTSAAHRERIFIGERMQKVKDELDSATKEFSVFASQNAAINIPDQVKAMVSAAADLQGQLIAAESQLKAMQQIYTDNNVDVRQMKALVAELRNQLNKFGGKDIKPSDGAKLSENELYPSIRQLPLLGVRYLDLYRRNKINEAAFELLSKEYEIAKIEEAREVPSVAILDTPSIPRKKSSPHRLVIMFLGTAFSVAIGVGIILGRNRWEETEADHPRKLLAVEILNSMQGHMHRNSRNGHDVLNLSSRRNGDRDQSRKSPEEEQA